MGDEDGDELEGANHKGQSGKVWRAVKQAARDAVDARNLVRRRSNLLFIALLCVGMRFVDLISGGELVKRQGRKGYKAPEKTGRDRKGR